MVLRKRRRREKREGRASGEYAIDYPVSDAQLKGGGDRLQGVAKAGRPTGFLVVRSHQ